MPIVVEQGPGDRIQIGGPPAFPDTIDVEASSFTISIAATCLRAAAGVPPAESGYGSSSSRQQVEDGMTVAVPIS